MGEESINAQQESPEVVRHREFAAGLRELADWYEAHPEVPLPYDGGGQPLAIYGLSCGGRDPKQVMAEIARAMGTCEKSSDEQFYRITKEFAGGLKLAAVAYHKEVCTKRTTQKTVKEQVPVRYEQVTRPEPVEWQEQEVVKEMVEWDCPESLLELDQRREMEQVEKTLDV